MGVFIFFALVAFIFSLGSISYKHDSTPDEITDDNYYVQEGLGQLFWGTMDLTPRGQFVYPPLGNMQYPTCGLSKELEFPDGELTALADYAFLATLIYQAPETLQGTLDEWFGPGVGTIESNMTSSFRQSIPGGTNAVNYNIVSFSNGMYVVLVRGSTTAWEWMTDAQLWAAIALTQVFQFFLPAGEIFDPILDGVMKAMAWVESQRLKEIALYTQTTQLVQFMRDYVGISGPIHITGQSLGGGIALITGAQANIPAIAISGPNNVFSRLTYDPPLDLDKIDATLFNVIPDRDLVPRVRHRITTGR